MIVLDTNVISEIMKPAPAPAVMDWVGRQPLANLALSSVTVAEIRYGLARLPEGARRARLEGSFQTLLDRGFGHRVLAFTRDAADLYGGLVAERERAGQSIDALDAMIAATARCFGAQVATRDVAGFSGCGLEVVDPWEAVP